MHVVRYNVCKHLPIKYFVIKLIHKYEGNRPLFGKYVKKYLFSGELRLEKSISYSFHLKKPLKNTRKIIKKKEKGTAAPIKRHRWGVRRACCGWWWVPRVESSLTYNTTVSDIRRRYFPAPSSSSKVLFGSLFLFSVFFSKNMKHE